MKDKKHLTSILEKLLFNPVRLKILSFLFSVESASFKKLMEISGATKGNISVQIKKLEDAGLIKVRKKFEGNYPLTLCKITSKGKTSFKVFLNSLQSYGINESADVDFKKQNLDMIKKFKDSNNGGTFIGTGTAIGVAVFAITNEPTWIAVGVAIGAAISWMKK